MMQLNVSKRTMMRLIREHKDQIGVPIPQPNCKEVRFVPGFAGEHRLSWDCGGSSFEVTLTPDLNLIVRTNERCQFHLVMIPLDRDWLMGLGILTDGEEGLECQG